MSYLTSDDQVEREREERRRLSRHQIMEHAKRSLLFTPFDVKWVPHAAIVVALGQYPNNTGALSVFELHGGELIPIVEFRTAMPLKCGTFIPSAPTSSVRRLVTGDFAGSVSVWDLEFGVVEDAPSDDVDGAASNTKAHFTCSILASDGTVAPATRDPTSTGPRRAAPTFDICKNAHAGIINSIDSAGGAGASGPPEVVTGGRDGSVKVWDPRQLNKPILALTPTDATRARDCWAVAFGNAFSADERVVAAGYDNGDIKLFDMKTNKMLQEFNVGNGVCGLTFDRKDIPLNKLIVALLEGRSRQYDLRTHHAKLGYAFVEEVGVSTGTLWCAKSLPQNRDVVLYGGAGEIILAVYRYPPDRSLKDADGLARGVPGTVEELNRAKVGDQPIHALDAHPDRVGLLAAASFDQTIRVMLATRLEHIN